MYGIRLLPDCGDMRHTTTCQFRRYMFGIDTHKAQLLLQIQRHLVH